MTGIRFDQTRDRLTVELGTDAVHHSEEVRPGVWLHLDAQGRVLGLEVHQASERATGCGAEGPSWLLDAQVVAAEREQARDNALLLRSVIDETPYPIILKDHKGDFLLANRALADLYHTTPEAMVGKHDDDFGVPKDMADFFRQNVLGVMARGQTEVVLEDSRDAATGEIRHFRSIKKPIRDAAGRMQLLVIAQDITDIVRSQQQVAESEQRLQEVLRITGEGVWDWDVPSGHVEHNGQWYAMLGFGEGDVPGTLEGFAQLIHPEDRDLVWQRIQTMLDGRANTYSSEHRMVTPQGVIWVRDRGGVARRDSNGHPLRIMGSVANITRQREQQAQAEEQRRTLHDIIEAINIGTWEWNLETGGGAVNERWAAIVGCTPQELEPVTARTWADRVHPDDRVPADDEMRRLLRGEISHYERELRMRHRDGHWVWVLVSGKVARLDGLGGPLLVRGTYLDISRRKLAEAKERESELLLRSAIDTIDEAFVVFDPDDRLVYCNDKYREVYPEVQDLTAPGHTFEEIVRTWKLRGGGEPAERGIDDWVRERLEHHRSGSVLIQRVEGGRWVKIVERRTADGYIVGFRVDITELKLAEERAEAANVAKSRFLATMSHELRTPMNGILGMAQLLQQPDVTESERQAFTQTILSSGQSLLGLLNDILDLSKVESGKMELERIVFDPVTLLGDSQALFAESARSKGLALTVRWHGAVNARYLGDPVRLRQMLNNLLSNAVKFTLRGHITIEARDTGPAASAKPDVDLRRIEFSVSDTGIGVPDDKLALLFQPFSQVDASTTRQFGGTGLGLSIVRSLSHLMGGESGVTSTPGTGSRFWFCLPLPVVPGTARDAGLSTAGRVLAAAPPTDAAPGFRGRVLVVEDHPMNRMVIQNMLERLGLQVAMAENGQVGVEAVQGATRPDVVLMDVEMPVLDGYQATERIRAEELAAGQPRLPVIALTANAFESDRQRAMAAGMDDFLAKPVNLETLRQMLARWLVPASR